VPLAANVPENWDETGAAASESEPAPCATFMPVVQTPRIAADMPMSDDVLKCQLKPIEVADYNGQLSATQLDELDSIFPDGVCDYNKPGVGDLAASERSIRWPSLGGATLRTQGGKLDPAGLEWRAVRSRPTP
jgi:hypothetical protein